MTKLKWEHVCVCKSANWTWKNGFLVVEIHFCFYLFVCWSNTKRWKVILVKMYSNFGWFCSSEYMCTQPQYTLRHGWMDGWTVKRTNERTSVFHTVNVIFRSGLGTFIIQPPLPLSLLCAEKAISIVYISFKRLTPLSFGTLLLLLWKSSFLKWCYG